jgi:hypothetical protein
LIGSNRAKRPSLHGLNFGAENPIVHADPSVSAVILRLGSSAQTFPRLHRRFASVCLIFEQLLAGGGRWWQLV